MRESKERTKLTEEEMRVVENSLLFSGIKRNEIQILLVCLKSQKVSYSKGEMIFRMIRPFFRCFPFSRYDSIGCSFQIAPYMRRRRPPNRSLPRPRGRQSFC